MIDRVPSVLPYLFKLHSTNTHFFKPSASYHEFETCVSDLVKRKKWNTLRGLLEVARGGQITFHSDVKNNMTMIHFPFSKVENLIQLTPEDDDDVDVLRPFAHESCQRMEWFTSHDEILIKCLIVQHGMQLATHFVKALMEEDNFNLSKDLFAYIQTNKLLLRPKVYQYLTEHYLKEGR
jgi:hypothetical protein